MRKGVADTIWSLLEIYRPHLSRPMAALAASRAYSESITLAFGGLILLLVLAVPTIRASLQEDWLKVSIVAACLFDQFCDPIGGRPIDHDVSVPLEDFPDAVVKLTPATEDSHFYDHVDLDFPGGATIVRRADFFRAVRLLPIRLLC